MKNGPTVSPDQVDSRNKKIAHTSNFPPDNKCYPTNIKLAINKNSLDRITFKEMHNLEEYKNDI